MLTGGFSHVASGTRSIPATLSGFPRFAREATCWCWIGMRGGRSRSVRTGIESRRAIRTGHTRIWELPTGRPHLDPRTGTPGGDQRASSDPPARTSLRPARMRS